jgi:flagellar motility protein MotE (MotC chaperone)
MPSSPLHWLRSKLNIRTLLITKFAILFVALLGISGQLQFGDRSMQAEDAAKTAPQPEKPVSSAPATKSNPAEGKPAAESKTASAADTGTNTKANTVADNKAEVVEEDATAPKRKSFLDGLLNLPPIDRSTSQREELSRFLDLAEQKQRQIQERISVMEKREAYLRELETAIEDKVRALENEKVLFQQSLQREKELADDRMVNLVEYYKKMEPKKAAPVIEKLDKDMVVKLFNKLPQKQVTQILAGMSAEKSVEITEYYGRVRSGKEYEMLKEMNQFLVDKFQDCKGMPATAH